uniref:Uncharacterized protein n=1 Tax=Chenopodium quinoa TaxID=63459 RepID=A0A803LVG6_CHEQI
MYVTNFTDGCGAACSTSGTLYTLLCCLTGCHSIYSCTYRSKLKAQLGIRENYCADFCSHCFCEYCALCQEYRELQHRGYRLALGWYGNMERQNPGIAMPPQVPSGMVRH